VPWHRDFSIVQFSNPLKDLLVTSRHLGTFAEQRDSYYYGKRNGQHVFASQACTFILVYKNYRVVTGYHYTSLSLKQTSATAVASLSHAGGAGALHMM
jgi:hypothetical protein